MPQGFIFFSKLLYPHALFVEFLLESGLLAFELSMGVIECIDHFSDFSLILLHLDQSAIDVSLLPIQQLFVAFLLMADGGLKECDFLLVTEIELLDGSRQLLLIGQQLLFLSLKLSVFSLQLFQACLERVSVVGMRICLVVHLNYTVIMTR